MMRRKTNRQTLFVKQFIHSEILKVNLLKKHLDALKIILDS